MAPKVEVSVEYCGAWGYAAHFGELAEEIKADVPEAEVNGFVGRRSSFEVKVNGKLVFSKLEKGGFPVFKEVVQVVLDCSQGSEPREVIEIAPNSCSLM